MLCICRLELLYTGVDNSLLHISFLLALAQWQMADNMNNPFGQMGM